MEDHSDRSRQDLQKKSGVLHTYDERLGSYNRKTDFCEKNKNFDRGGEGVKFKVEFFEFFP